MADETLGDHAQRLGFDLDGDFETGRVFVRKKGHPDKTFTFPSRDAARQAFYLLEFDRSTRTNG